MKNRHLFALLDTSYTTVGVAFLNQAEQYVQAPAAPQRGKMPQAPAWGDSEGSGYTYKAPKTMDLKVGDLVVVESKYGICLANVVRVDLDPVIDLDADFDYKWIAQRVDFTAYNELVLNEQTFNANMIEVERVKQRESLLDSFRNSLPEGSAARELFERTTAILPAPAPSAPPPPDAGAPEKGA